MSDAVRNDRFETGELVKKTFALLRGNAGRAAIAMVALTAVGAAADSGATERGLTFLFSILSLVVQYWLTVAALESLGLRSVTKARLPALFLLGILTTLGILLGLVLLIVPGIILFVRWSISGAAVVATEAGVIDSIAYSWRSTQGRFWVILSVFLVLYAPALAGAVAGGALEVWLSDPLVGTVILNLFFNAALIMGWHGAVAIYAATREPTGLSEVFA